MANANPSNPYRPNDRYENNCKKRGLAWYEMNEKPENSMSITDIADAKNTLFCAFMAATATKPMLCAINDVSKLAIKNIKYLDNCGGCDVR